MSLDRLQVKSIYFTLVATPATKTNGIADSILSGGLEMLFDNKRRHSLSIPANDKDAKPANIAFLINYLCENLMKDPRAELFVLDGHMFVSLANCLSTFYQLTAYCIAVQAFLFSSTTQIGNLKTKKPMRYRPGTTFSSSRLFTVVRSCCFSFSTFHSHVHPPDGRLQPNHVALNPRSDSTRSTALPIPQAQSQHKRYAKRYLRRFCPTQNNPPDESKSSA